MAENLEKTANLYELVELIRTYLRKIKKKYSQDDLHDYFVKNFKKLNNTHSTLSFELMSTYLTVAESNANRTPRSFNSKESSTAVLNAFNSTSRLNFATNGINGKPSTSQLKKSQGGVKGSNAAVFENGKSDNQPILKLIKNLDLFRKLFEIAQRDLLYDLLEFEMPTNSIKKNGVESTMLLSSSTNQILNSSVLLLKEESNSSLKHTEQQPSTEYLFNLNQLNPSNNSNINNNINNPPKPINYFIEHGKMQSNLTNSSELSAGLNKRIAKNTQKILDLNEKLSILLNDETTSDLKLLSNHSMLPTSKCHKCKYGEFLLRFTIDVEYKLKFLIKLCEKNYELFYVLFNNGASVSKSKGLNRTRSFILKSIVRKRQQHQHQPSTHHATEPPKLPRLNSRSLNKTFMINNNGISVDAESSQNNNNNNNNNKTTEGVDIGPYAYKYQLEQINNNVDENINDGSDSFIQETDCSSILSEEEAAVANQYISSSPIQSQIPLSNAMLKSKIKKQLKAKLKSMEINIMNNNKLPNHKLTWSSIYRITDRAELINKYNYIKSQQDSTLRTIDEFYTYMESLHERTQRCGKLEEQLRADEDFIRKTESSMRFYTNNNSNEVSDEASSEAFRSKLRKQIDYLRYKRKMTLQDLSVERICVEEIRLAIKDVEHKVAHFNYYLKDLSKFSMYIETQLQIMIVDKQKKKQQHHQSVSQLVMGGQNNKSKKLPPLLQQQQQQSSLMNLSSDHFSNSHQQFYPYRQQNGSNQALYNIASKNSNNPYHNHNQAANYQSQSYLNNKYAQYNI